MSKIRLGQFINDDSLVHRLDPRTKLVSCSLIIFSVLVNSHWEFLLVYVLLITLAIALANLKVPKVFKSLRKLRYLLILTFIFQAILTRGEPLFFIGTIHVTKEGVLLGISTMLRLLIIYLSSTLLTVSTSPVKLASGLEALLRPLRHLKVPVQQLAMIIGTALRFVPTFIEEADIITKAQMSRGAQLNTKKIVVRFKAMIAIIIPLLAASLQRASDLAVAMESRCYMGEANHVRLHNMHYKKTDKLVLAIVVAVFMSAIIDKLYFILA